MFYGNAKGTAVSVRDLLEILMELYKVTFIIYSHHLIRLNKFLIRVFENVMVILIIGFQILSLFCVAYGICTGKNFIL